VEFIETELKESALPVGENRCVEVGGVVVGLFRTADGIFALNNECPHRGAPLHEGWVADGHVTCPLHQWEFDLATGACRGIPKVKAATYPVEIRDGTIWICPRDEGKR
jgi:nitrite reductase/ring-hydroxylating ferredoxin subunit